MVSLMTGQRWAGRGSCMPGRVRVGGLELWITGIKRSKDRWEDGSNLNPGTLSQLKWLDLFVGVDRI